MPKKSLPTLLVILGILLLLLPAFLKAATQSALQKESPTAAPETKTTLPEAKQGEFIPNSDCLGCHGEKIDEKKFLTSVHATSSCTSCHQNVTHIDQHEKTRGAKAEPESATCHRCHKKEAAEHYAGAHYRHEIQCKDCHSDIHEMTAWKGDKVRVIQKCTTCHSDDGYSASVHGQSVLGGNPDSATCSDCHGLHLVPILKGEESNIVEFRKGFHTEVCQKCHADKEMMERNKVFLIATQTYYESYHGKVEGLGYPGVVAGCADCHGFHSILPPSDPKSLTSDARLVETCGNCHSRANVNFVKWLPHATHKDPEREPVLYWTFVLMTSLVVSVLGVFWLHTVLWWRKEFWERRALRAKGIFFPRHVPSEEGGQIYRRFRLFDIVLHATMMTTFIALVLTGLRLKYPHAPWGSGLMHFLGGVGLTGLIHRVCAAITFGYFATTLAYVAYFLLFKKVGGSLNPIQKLFGPDSLCPRWKDVEDIAGMIRWFLNKGPKPSFDRWTYWEKFDFLAVFWGMFAIGLSGLMLWFPEFFTLFLPGWVLNIATIVHSDETLLVSGFIFTVHFFNTHLRPSKFPMDTVIFTGRLPKHEWVKERSQQYERMLAEGTLETRRDKYPSVATDLFSEFVGFGMLAIGLLCIFLIAWEFLG
jgi:cytochrome b subunit of formate dehydrogenase